MPHTKSAKKRLRQSQVRRMRNRAVKSDLRTHIKKLRTAVADGRAEEAATLLRTVYQKLDKCAARKYLHHNTADRTKSRLTQLCAKAGDAGAGTATT